MQELASLLPNLKNAKDTQLSKHVIVDESVKHHHAQEASIQELTQALDDVKKRHEQLLQEVSAWRDAAQWHPGGVNVSGAPAVSTAQVQVQGELDSNSGIAHVRAGVPDYAAASEPPRSVLPELGTYPASLVQLGSDHTAAGEVQRLDGLADSIPGSGSEMLHLPENLQGYNPNSMAVFQDVRLQRLFGRFQDPGVLDQTPVETSHPPLMPANSADWNSIPLNVQDLWRMQWALNHPGGWPHPPVAGESGEMDLHTTMLLRNDTPIMNI